MTITATLSNYYKTELMTGKINLGADSIKVLLMRTGYAFDRDVCAKKINVMTNSGALALVFNTDKTITRPSGSFVTDGFIVGNQIITDSSNNPGPFTILTATALIITVNEAVVNESVTKTITSNDEIATGYGYTRDTKVLATQVVAEDDALDLGAMTCADISWAASGGSIGPAAGAIFYDDTATGDPVIGYLSFGTDQTAPNGASFLISGVKFRVA